jgi:hypothetical protein
MYIPTMASEPWPSVAACALAVSLAACGTPQHAVADSATTARVMVKLVRPSDNATAIAAEATRVAGVPVTYAAATSAAWHALSLRCASASDCEAAIARLRSAAAVYETVEVDSRKTRSAS